MGRIQRSRRKSLMRRKDCSTVQIWKQSQFNIYNLYQLYNSNMPIQARGFSINPVKLGTVFFISNLLLMTSTLENPLVNMFAIWLLIDIHKECTLCCCLVFLQWNGNPFLHICKTKLNSTVSYTNGWLVITYYSEISCFFHLDLNVSMLLI